MNDVQQSPVVGALQVPTAPVKPKVKRVGGISTGGNQGLPKPFDYSRSGRSKTRRNLFVPLPPPEDQQSPLPEVPPCPVRKPNARSRNFRNKKVLSRKKLNFDSIDNSIDQADCDELDDAVDGGADSMNSSFSDVMQVTPENSPQYPETASAPPACRHDTPNILQETGEDKILSLSEGSIPRMRKRVLFN